MTSGTASPDSYEEVLLRNPADESVPWVVQKYGGTSVGKSLDSITRIVEYVTCARSRVELSADHTSPTRESRSSARPARVTRKPSARRTCYCRPREKHCNPPPPAPARPAHRRPSSPNALARDSSVPEMAAIRCSARSRLCPSWTCDLHLPRLSPRLRVAADHPRVQTRRAYCRSHQHSTRRWM